MPDNLTKSQRRKNMQNIRSCCTAMELQIQRALRKRRISFRCNVATVIGKPDLVFYRPRVIVFLDSCFWHMCPYHYNIPATRKDYWLPKLRQNRIRDRKVATQLRKEGWTVLRFWEHQIKKGLRKCVDRIEKVIETKKQGKRILAT